MALTVAEIQIWETREIVSNEAPLSFCRIKLTICEESEAWVIALGFKLRCEYRFLTFIAKRGQSNNKVVVKTLDIRHSDNSIHR